MGTDKEDYESRKKDLADLVISKNSKLNVDALLVSILILLFILSYWLSISNQLFYEKNRQGIL